MRGFVKIICHSGFTTWMIFILLATVSVPALSAIKISPHNQLVWPGDDKSTTLIINMFEKKTKFEELMEASKGRQILDWVEDFLSVEFDKNERNAIINLSVYVISVQDMDEYGSSNEPINTVAKLDFKKSNMGLELISSESEIDLSRYLKKPIEINDIVKKNATKGAIKSNNSNVKINAPTTYFLVESYPQKIYFENLTLSEDRFDYVYLSSGAETIVIERKQRYVTFNPKVGSAGEYKLIVDVRNWKYEPVKRITLNIVVVPKDSGSNIEQQNILVIGHSLATIWPAYLHQKFATRDKFSVSFIGSLPFFHKLPDVKQDIQSKTRREASSAFSISNLLYRYQPAEIPVPNQPAKSPFLFEKKNGEFAIDMNSYKTTALGGVSPDFILLNTGDNDTWALPLSDKTKRNEMLNELKVNVKKLIFNLKKLNSNVKIGLIMPPNYNHSSKAWKLNYGEKYTLWSQKQRRYYFMEIMKSIAASDDNIFALPTEFVNDGGNDLPFNSGTHLSLEGLDIFTEQSYAWIKSTLVSTAMPNQTEKKSSEGFWSTLNPFN